MINRIRILTFICLVSFIVLNNCSKSDKSNIQDIIKAAEHGDVSAQFHLGWCYAEGEGVEQSWSQAVKWYNKASEGGSIRAINNLGLCYENGQGVEQSFINAVKLYKIAAEQGHVSAQYNLARCYSKGIGVEKSDVEAAKWYLRAAEEGDADSQFSIGICYSNGDGVPLSKEKAFYWFHKAAKQGYIKAETNLGWCYANGIGVKQSWPEAIKWYRSAASKGDEFAEVNLAKVPQEYLNSEYNEERKHFTKISTKTDSIVIKIRESEPLLIKMTEIVLANPRWKAKVDEFHQSNKQIIEKQLKAIKDTNSLEDRLWLGFTYGGQLDCKLALEQYYEVIKKSPDIIDPWLGISRMIYNLMNVYLLAEVEADPPISYEKLFNGKDPVIEIGILAIEILDYSHGKSIYPSESTIKLLPEGGDISLKRQIGKFIGRRGMLNIISPK